MNLFYLFHLTFIAYSPECLISSFLAISLLFASVINNLPCEFSVKFVPLQIEQLLPFTNILHSLQYFFFISSSPRDALSFPFLLSSRQLLPMLAASSSTLSLDCSSPYS